MTVDKGAPEGRTPTLRDVAAVAGVSIWTASTTFSKPERVAESTRQRVHEAAVRLGYTGPHPAARSLARGRTGMLAFVAPGAADALLGDPAAALVARGMLSACDRAGYSLVLTAQARDEAVDGQVFLNTVPDRDVRVPAVVVDGRADGADAVMADTPGAGEAAMAYLRRLGHRDVAVLTWPGAADRLEGATRAWHGRDPLPVHQGPGGGRPGEQTGDALVRAALAAPRRPTALLALNDALALSAMQTLTWMGVAVPGDVSVMGVDDVPAASAAGLSTVMVPYRPMGERAVDVVLARREGRVPDPAPALPTVLIPRRSTGPPRRDGR